MPDLPINYIGWAVVILYAAIAGANQGLALWQRTRPQPPIDQRFAPTRHGHPEYALVVHDHPELATRDHANNVFKAAREGDAAIVKRLDDDRAGDIRASDRLHADLEQIRRTIGDGLKALGTEAEQRASKIHNRIDTMQERLGEHEGRLDGLARHVWGKSGGIAG